MPIRYQVAVPEPASHRFEVRLTVPQPDPQGQGLALPAWIPGSYLIRDFARHLLQLEARAEGAAVAVTKLDKSTWRCAPCRGPLELCYTVHAYDLSVRGAYLDTTRAYFNGSSLLLRVLGQAQRPCRLEILRPQGAQQARWRAVCTLTAVRVDDAGFGCYGAADYEALIDHPVEMGELRMQSFDVAGIPHAIALSGRADADLERVAGDLGRICAQHMALFAAPAPMDRYVFLVHATRAGDGGLEHGNCCSLIVTREHLPLAGRRLNATGYRRFLGLCSHEYFHLWSVKRIRPRAFVGCGLEREVYTRLLWVFEGITSYYDDLALARAGVITPAEYLELLAETASAVWQTPGRLHQSLADSSFDAWIKLYKPDENAPNAFISYYTKGALAGLALDLTIRRDTGGTRSLDDVMRALWARHGPGSPGVEEEDFEQIACEVSGLDLRAFFDAAVRGTRDLALGELLAGVGVRFELRAHGGGATPGRDYYASGAGMRLRDQGGALAVAHVLDGSAAQAAGIAGGDEIVAVDGLKVAGAARLAEHIAARAAGARLTLHLFRRDELLTSELLLREPPLDQCRMTLVEEAGPEARARREAWLGPGPR